MKVCAKCGRQIHMYSEPYVTTLVQNNDLRSWRNRFLAFLSNYGLPVYWRKRRTITRAHVTCPTGPDTHPIFTKTFIFFGIWLVIGAIEGIVELFTHSYIVIPIYGLGYLTFLWQDYCWLCLGDVAGAAALMGYVYEAAN